MQKIFPNAIEFPKTKGFFGIGIENGQGTRNVGTIWRSAQIMGANFMFTIGGRYNRMKTDTMAGYRTIPMFEFDTLDEFYRALPKESKLIGVELDERSVPIAEFKHPKRAVYLLGSEGLGLSQEAMALCHQIVQLPGTHCMNVSVTGSLIIYDRLMREGYKLENKTTDTNIIGEICRSTL